LSKHLGKIGGFQIELPAVLVDARTNLRRLRDRHVWLASAAAASDDDEQDGGSAVRTRLACKPDVLLASRSRQSGLVLLDASLEEVEKFVDGRVGRRAYVGGVEGTLSHFVVAPYVPHAAEDEFDLHIESRRLCNVITFGPHAGRPAPSATLEVAVESEISPTCVTDALGLARMLPAARVRECAEFICAVYRFFDGLDFTLLEFRPLAVLPPDAAPPGAGIMPLDARGVLDHYAEVRAGPLWGPVEFPMPWGHPYIPEEEAIEAISGRVPAPPPPVATTAVAIVSQSAAAAAAAQGQVQSQHPRHQQQQQQQSQQSAAGTATLRLTVINSKARVWFIAAGAGSAMICGDTLVDLGYGHELANFCEYSGFTTEDQTYLLCKTILTLATKSGRRGRALIIGGCIANYTDVSVTFKGFVHAIRELATPIKAVDMRILVRRAGPNYHQALRAMTVCGQETGVDIRAFGPEVQIPSVVAMAVQHINAFKSTDVTDGAEVPTASAEYPAPAPPATSTAAAIVIQPMIAAQPQPQP
jgi:ATP citrate (pro-S)-lyase